MNGRRSPTAQLEAMRRDWPEFEGHKEGSGLLVWRGLMRPKAQIYEVGIAWKAGATDRPFVYVLNPRIQPRPEGRYEEIPHLMFDKKEPELSALCLFDPAGNEWSDRDLIAETTVKWASAWLFYYELWHLFGEWLGPSVGYESAAQIADAEEARAVRAAADHVH